MEIETGFIFHANKFHRISESGFMKCFMLKCSAVCANRQKRLTSFRGTRYVLYNQGRTSLAKNAYNVVVGDLLGR